jgi:hypothetical protein
MDNMMEQSFSLLSAAGESCRRSLLIKLVLFSIVRLLVSEHHRRLSSKFWVIVPNRLAIVNRRLLLEI